MHLAIRADGGPEIGYGHLIRSGALASEFLSWGHEVTFVTRTPAVVEDACPDGTAAVRLDDDAPESLVRWLAVSEADAILIDSYSVGTGYQAAVRGEVTLLAVVVDDAVHEVCADVVTNGNAHAADLDYNHIGDEPEWCLGTDYLLLRGAFSVRACREPPWRDLPQRGIVTMGGSDIRNATPTAVRAFADTGLRLDIVVGPGFSPENREAIRAATAGLDTVVIHQEPDVEKLAEAMFRADIAVSATGTTVYELLATGTPTIGVPQVENQIPVAEALADRDALSSLELGATAERIQQELRDLLDDKERRRSLQSAGCDLVDGRGAERLYRVIARRT